jgi:guanosine-3',5'-bis(diphosphate) 3'-pyrophosphohydrolase
MLTATQLVDKIKIYSPEADTEVVGRAYAFARQAHHGQTRYSGEPYFTHLVATALNLIHMQLDPVTIAAGLLHDVTEDTDTSLETLEAEFGPEIAFLVNAVTKVSKVRLGTPITDGAAQVKTDGQLVREQAAIENLRKMLLAMAQDIRVVLIKLADRLHNMETLIAVPEEKQRRIALETMEVYAPLAERLGMGEMKGRLEDLAFPFVDPEGFAWLNQQAAPLYAETDRYLRRVMRFIEGELEAQGITASVHGRAKHLYSLYKKVQAKDRDLQDIHDLIAVRILVDDVHGCYEVLGMLHHHWKPLMGRIKDYIALPKPNGYQSLHTTVFCLDGRVVEFQIRTQDMHRAAEYGIAAHWSYSGYKTGQTGLRKQLPWVEQLAKWQADLSNSQDFLEALKIDTFKHRIFVFTPQGEVKDLPVGATSLDFAYQVHTKIGDHTFGAKINGKLSHLSTQLQNGDVVEILTNAKSQPRPDWLDLVVTSSAKGHIRRALREQEPLELIVEKSEKIVEKPIVESEASNKAQIMDPEVLVEGRSGYLVHLAQCCQPKVGDSIIGLVAGDKGISVHQRWCTNVRNIGDMSRLVQVSWRGQEAKQRVHIRMEAYDKRGLTRELASAITDTGWNIVGVRGDSMDEGVVAYSMLVEADGSDDITGLIAHLQQHPNIYLVERQ